MATSIVTRLDDFTFDIYLGTPQHIIKGHRNKPDLFGQIRILPLQKLTWHYKPVS